jgi:hypothetical protein
MRMHARSTALKLLAPVMLSLLPAPLLAAPTKAPSKAPAPTSAPAPAVPLEPRAILDQVDDLFRGNWSHGKLSMEVVTSYGKRQLDLEQWSKGKTHFLVRILSPEREKGTSTLKVNQNIWNYLPNVDRTIKLSTSMMSGSWMGSHFTNNDLVKQSRFNDTYDAKVSFKGARGGTDLIELTLLPRQDATVVWGKLVVTVRADHPLPTQIDYYDEALEPVQTMTFSDVRALGGRTLPTRVRMQPKAKPNEYTELRYQLLEFDAPLEDSFFSTRTLQKR